MRSGKRVQTYRLIGLIACLAGLGACATDSASPLVAQVSGSQMDRVEEPVAYRSDMLAQALSDAEAAAATNDASALAKAVLTIDSMGAQPLTDADMSRLASWQGQSPDQQPAMRGRTLGPAFRSGSVAPGNSTIIKQTFYGGTTASVSLRVPAGSALRLRVVDQSNRRVCERAASQASCRWMPLFTQQHRIEIVNERSENAKYYIVFD